MRNSYIYNVASVDSFFKILMSKSKETKYISVLMSNRSTKSYNLPSKYIDCDLIAGLGMIKEISSNKNSLSKLRTFHHTHNDWLFGYLSYDLKNEIEELSSENCSSINSDNIAFFIPEYVFLLRKNKLEVLTYQSKTSVDLLLNNYKNLDNKNINSIFLTPKESKEEYLNKIRKIKDHIQKGDIYELNYCVEYYAKEILKDPESLFIKLNNINRNPFSSFLHINNHYVMCASPERFLRKDGSSIISQPIKGTIKRGSTPYEDKLLINKLKGSQKDISENVMIIDLVRNDLSITANRSSVRVDDFCGVYTFDRIHQMISTISSEVPQDCHFINILETTFPMGSMTGAPKLKAMELIDKYEESSRGIFSGSIGYISPTGDFDFNVVIRSIIYNKEKEYISAGVGGAITISSDEYCEYEECLLKIKPILEALVN